MSRPTRTIVALATLLAAACSSGGGGSSTGAPPLDSPTSRGDYAERLAGWLCDDLAACCESTQQTVDRDACVAAKRAAELHRVASEEARSGRVFDETMAATCIARLQEAPAECGAERRVKECFQTYDGVREIGEACSGRIQCRGSVSGDVGCVAGVCALRLAAGEACTLGDGPGRCDVCRPDARCRESADGNHYCYGYQSRPGVAGDPCSKDFTPPTDPTQVSVIGTCDDEDGGLYCSLDGICTPFTALGGACTLPHECGRGANCVDHICVTGLAEGQTCRSLFHDCGPGLDCRFADESRSEGRCTAPAGVGEACGRLVRCARDLACQPAAGPGSDGQCVTPEANLCTHGLRRLARQSS